MAWPQKSQCISSTVVTSQVSSHLSTGEALKLYIKKSMWDGRHCYDHFWKVQAATPYLFIHSVNKYLLSTKLGVISSMVKKNNTLAVW